MKIIHEYYKFFIQVFNFFQWKNIYLKHFRLSHMAKIAQALNTRIVVSHRIFHATVLKLMLQSAKPSRVTSEIFNFYTNEELEKNKNYMFIYNNIDHIYSDAFSQVKNIIFHWTCYKNKLNKFIYYFVKSWKHEKWRIWSCTYIDLLENRMILGKMAESEDWNTSW